MNCFQGSGKILGASYLKGCGRLTLCSVCSQNKSSSAPPAGLLQPLPVWQCLWLDISLDFVTGLLPSDGNTVILTVVGRFSKMLKFIALPKLCFSKETEEMVHSNIFWVFGFPRNVLSHRGPQFMPRFWKAHGGPQDHYLLVHSLSQRLLIVVQRDSDFPDHKESVPHFMWAQWNLFRRALWFPCVFKLPSPSLLCQIIQQFPSVYNHCQLFPSASLTAFLLLEFGTIRWLLPTLYCLIITVWVSVSAANIQQHLALQFFITNQPTRQKIHVRVALEWHANIFQ